MNQTARLILEASTGMHGEIAKQLADAWTEIAEKCSRLEAEIKDHDQGPSGNPSAWDFTT